MSKKLCWSKTVGFFFFFFFFSIFTWTQDLRQTSWANSRKQVSLFSVCINPYKPACYYHEIVHHITKSQQLSNHLKFSQRQTKQTILSLKNQLFKCCIHWTSAVYLPYDLCKKVFWLIAEEIPAVDVSKSDTFLRQCLLSCGCNGVTV